MDDEANDAPHQDAQDNPQGAAEHGDEQPHIELTISEDNAIKNSAGEIIGERDPDRGKPSAHFDKPTFKVDNNTRIHNLLMPNNLLKYQPSNPGRLPIFRKVENSQYVPMNRPSIFFKVDD